MRTFLLACLLALIPAASALRADDLTVTLPNGRSFTFQTEEQRAKFLAALDRRAPATATAPAPPAVATTPPPAVVRATASQAASANGGLGHTALDDKPRAGGLVNVNAPTFTADYYLTAPETWVGKHITLSVAYVQTQDAITRSDGMKQITAMTCGPTRAGSEQSFGGSISVIAPPAGVMRLAQQCGTTTQYNAWVVRTFLIKGEFAVLPSGKESAPGRKLYCVIVDK